MTIGRRSHVDRATRGSALRYNFGNVIPCWLSPVIGSVCFVTTCAVQRYQCCLRLWMKVGGIQEDCSSSCVDGSAIVKRQVGDRLEVPAARIWAASALLVFRLAQRVLCAQEPRTPVPCTTMEQRYVSNPREMLLLSNP